MDTNRQLPLGWAWAEIGEISRPRSNWNPKAAEKDDFAYIDIDAIDNVRQRIASPKQLAVTRAPSRARVLVSEGDILFSLVRPYLKNIAVVPETLDGEVASTAFVSVKPADGIYSAFAFHQLVQDAFIASVPTYGNSPPAARDEEFFALKLAVAPTAEQRRISEKLEELLSDLDASVTALERARANLKRYRAAVLKAAVEGKLTAEWRKANPPKESADKLLERILAERRKKWEEGQLAAYAALGKQPSKGWQKKYQEPNSARIEELPSLPSGWTWATLQQLCDQVVDCEHSTAKFTAKGVACIDTTCMRSQEIVKDRLRFVDERTYSFRVRRLVPRPGDLVFAREGTVGTVVVIPTGFRCCLGQRVMLFRPHHGIPSEWLASAIESELFRAQYRPKILGTTSPHLNVGEIKELAVPVAPPAEQAAILEKVSVGTADMPRIERVLIAEQARASRLRQAILKRAFEGKLVPQDPNDEPASVLLERIRAARAANNSSAKDAVARKGSRGPRAAEGSDAAVRARKKPSKRNLFAELPEGSDALERERDG